MRVAHPFSDSPFHDIGYKNIKRSIIIKKMIHQRMRMTRYDNLPLTCLRVSARMLCTFFALLVCSLTIL